MKHTFDRKLSIIALILTMLISIKINSQELIPLKVDNNWKYVKNEAVNGEIIKTDTVTSKVGKIVFFNNKKWFHMNELGDKYVVRNDEQGQYELDTLNTQKNGNFKEVLMFKNNESPKQISYTAYENIKITIESGTKLIKTEIGDFECIKYTLIPQEAKPGEIIEFYFKPGIGLIYHQWIEGEKITTCKLIEYNLK